MLRVKLLMQPSEFLMQDHFCIFNETEEDIEESLAFIEEEDGG